MPTLDQLVAQVQSLAAVLDRRTMKHRQVTPYDEGGCPVPQAIIRARVTQAYRALMPAAEAPWGSLVVDSVQDRLEVAGIRDTDEQTARAVWSLWQENAMDAESKLGHRSALLDGRAFALCWPDKDTKQPLITLDDATQMVVQYEEGSRRRRVAALRRWIDEDGTPYATLYRPDGVYKFQATSPVSGMRPTWARRIVQGEDWPLPNPWGVVPVVELAVNRRLKPGSFGAARGEFEHCTGLIDRINLLTFLGLVVAFWMGFPLRALIGDKILRTDDGTPLGTPQSAKEGGKPVPPFDVAADSIVQIENPAGKLDSFPAADRKNLSVFAELDQLAVITKTPRHYFPLEQGMSNLSADAIRASEGALHAKVGEHKASLGEGWEEVMRIAGRQLPDNPVELSSRAELVWKDSESRSLAERADAASKLKDVLPNAALWQYVLNLSDNEISRLEGQQASSAFGQLLTEAAAPPSPAAPTTNGATAAAA